MSNPQNPHVGEDAIGFLNSIIPNAPEMQVQGLQEAMRILLTQLLIDARKSSNLSHKEIADKIYKDEKWVKKAENCNYAHTWDEFITYLYALDADFELAVTLRNGHTIELDSKQIKKMSE